MAAQEATALQSLRAGKALGLGPLESLCLFSLTGPDTAGYLHRRSTSDVAALENGQGQPSAMLEAKARVQSVFTLHRLEDAFYALVESAQAGSFQQGIQKYKILEQFSLSDESEAWGFLLAWGAGWETLLVQAGLVIPTEDNGITRLQLAGQETLAIRNPFFQVGPGGEGVLFCVPKPTLQTVTDDLKTIAQEARCPLLFLDKNLLKTLSLETGLPRWGVEMDENTVLPETGLETWTTSATKGCYPGQETVAKVATYGGLQKGLMGLLLEPHLLESRSELPAVPVDLLLDGKPVGRMTRIGLSPTLGRPIAMAFLQREQRVPGSTLLLEIKGKPYPVTVSTLPFYNPKIHKRQQAKALLDKGMAQFVAGEAETALATLRQAITADPSFTEAYESLGVILGRLERYDEAIAMMDTLQALDPDSVMVHTNRSVFHMKQGRIEAAEEEKAKATLKAMQNKMRESQAAKQTADTPPTDSALTQATPIPTAAAAEEQAAILRDRIAMFKTALEYHPTDPMAHFGIGSAYLDLGEYASAISAFEKVLDRQPTNLQAWLGLGKAHEGLGREENARQTYLKGIETAARRGDRKSIEAMQTRLQALPTPKA